MRRAGNAVRSVVERHTLLIGERDFQLATALAHGEVLLRRLASRQLGCDKRIDQTREPDLAEESRMPFLRGEDAVGEGAVARIRTVAAQNRERPCTRSRLGK